MNPTTGVHTENFDWLGGGVGTFVARGNCYTFVHTVTTW